MEHVIHLSKDKRLKKLIESQPVFVLEKRNKVYLRLCSSILSQQLSTTVAKVLYKRFLGLYNGKEPTAKQILILLQKPFEALVFQMQRLLTCTMFAGFL